jgi:hypothetical protein
VQVGIGPGRHSPTVRPAAAAPAARGRSVPRIVRPGLFRLRSPKALAAADVEIRRNDTIVTVTANDGAHTDNLIRRTGVFRYRVSHPGGSPVSNEVTVTF